MEFLFLCGFMNCSVMICLGKWKFFDFYESKRVTRKHLPDWCDFCFFFWLSVIEQCTSFKFVVFPVEIPSVIFASLAGASISTLLFKMIRY